MLEGTCTFKREQEEEKKFIRLKCFDISFKWLGIFLPAPTCTVKYFISIPLSLTERLGHFHRARSPSTILRVALMNS